MNKLLVSVVISLLVMTKGGKALPPPEDIPEEVLRGQIILQGRSPINGQELTPTEYAQLEKRLQKSTYPPELYPSLRERVFLLELRQFLRLIIPNL